MTYGSDSPTGQAYLTDAVLWLLGTPLAILDVLYLAYGAPPITPNVPETLVVWVLGLIALALLAWNLLSSVCAHLATLRHVPDPLRRAAHLLVSRFGTRLSRSLLARAGASALIGSALVTSVPLGGALAAPQDTGPRGVSPDMGRLPRNRRPHIHRGLPNHERRRGKHHRSGHGRPRSLTHLGGHSHLDARDVARKHGGNPRLSPRTHGDARPRRCPIASRGTRPSTRIPGHHRHA